MSSRYLLFVVGKNCCNFTKPVFIRVLEGECFFVAAAGQMFKFCITMFELVAVWLVWL